MDKSKIDIQDVIENAFPGFNEVTSVFPTLALDPVHDLGYEQKKIEFEGDYYKVLVRSVNTHTQVSTTSGMQMPTKYIAEGYEMLVLPIDSINVSSFNLEDFEKRSDMQYQLIPSILKIIEKFYESNPDFKLQMQRNDTLYSVFAVSLSEKKVFLLV